MKKIAITFGLISGGIAALMMFVTIPLVGRVSYEYLTVLGYTIFVACFLMVFFGIRSYRDNVGGGTIIRQGIHGGDSDYVALLCDLHHLVGLYLPPVPSNLYG
jgi:hypothetical protein